MLLDAELSERLEMGVLIRSAPLPFTLNILQIASIKVFAFLLYSFPEGLILPQTSGPVDLGMSLNKSGALDI